MTIRNSAWLRERRSTVAFRATRALGLTVSRVARSVGRWREKPLAPGRFTVLTVNWNTGDYLATVLDAVERFSPSDIEVIVVDNGSDEIPHAAVDRPGVRLVRLPLNLGHGPALDLATALVRTEFLVTIDVDAYPVSPDWLAALRGLLETGNEVAGGRLYRNYAHPSLLAIRTTRFRHLDHSFVRSNWRTGDDFVHGVSCDVGERISMREAPRVALIEASESRGPGNIGTVYGGLVYHNGVSSHGKAENRREGRLAWDEARLRFLGPTD